MFLSPTFVVFGWVCQFNLYNYASAVNVVKGVAFNVTKTPIITFYGEESRDPNSAAVDVVGYLTTQGLNCNQEDLTTAHIVLDTIVSPYNVAKHMPHPLMGTFQLLDGVKFVEKRGVLRAVKSYFNNQKTLSYNGRFIADDQVNIVLFGGYATFEKMSIENLQLVKTLCGRVSCASILPIKDIETFNKAVFKPLAFKSHFFYRERAPKIALPHSWHYIHDDESNTTCPFETIHSTMNTNTIHQCIDEAMNFLDREIRLTLLTSLQQAVIDDKASDLIDQDLLSLISPSNFYFMREYKFYEFDEESRIICYKLLGNGMSADVYLGNDLVRKQRVAVKKGANEDEFLNHGKIYDACSEYMKTPANRRSSVPEGLSFPPIPKILSNQIEIKESQKTSDTNEVMVSKHVYTMELLGPNLNHVDLRAFCEKFPIICYRDIALQILDRIYLLHETGWIHADLKPHNLMFGLGKNKKLIYLTDFGVMENLGKITSTHTRRFGLGEIRGTDVFMSHQTNMGHQILWNDNYISAGYIIMYLIRGGNLPWLHLGATASYGSELGERIKQHSYIELKSDLDTLCHGVEGGAQMKKYFDYLYDCNEWWKKPDIKILRGFIENILLNSRDRNMNEVLVRNTLYNIPLESWNLVPVHCLNHPINFKGDLVPKIQSSRATIYIEEKALIQFTKTQTAISFTDVVVQDGTEFYYVMFLPGREKLLSTLCNKNTLPCILITENGRSLIAFGNHLSPFIHATISAELFQIEVCAGDTVADSKHWAIKTRTSDEDQKNEKGFFYANSEANMKPHEESNEWNTICTEITAAQNSNGTTISAH